MYVLLGCVMKSAKLLRTAILEGWDFNNLFDMSLMNELGSIVASLETLYGLSVLIS